MKRQRKVDEKRQHRLTDFLRRALNNLVIAGIFCLVLVLCAFVIIIPGPKPRNHLNQASASQTSPQNYKQSKPRSTTFNTLRRTYLPEIPETVNLGVGWPDLSLLRTYYTKPQPKPERQLQAADSSLNSKPDSESE